MFARYRYPDAIVIAKTDTCNSFLADTLSLEKLAAANSCVATTTTVVSPERLWDRKARAGRTAAAAVADAPATQPTRAIRIGHEEWLLSASYNATASCRWRCMGKHFGHGFFVSKQVRKAFGGSVKAAVGDMTGCRVSRR